jgi:hypothetical protein
MHPLDLLVLILQYQHLYASPTRYSTLGLYNIASVPVSVTKSLASPSASLASIPPHNIATDTQITWSEHLQTTHARGIYEYMPR